MKKSLIIGAFFLLASSSLFGEWILQESGVDGKLYDICFVDVYHGWIAAGSDSGKVLIFRTTNGGVNWEKVYTDTNQVLYSVGFFDSLEGWDRGKDARAGEYNISYPAVFVHTTDGW